MKKRILVLCTANSARSQMAEGILRQDFGDTLEVCSAGTRPGRVRPEAILALAEIGIDISNHRSKSVVEFEGQQFDVVLTVCDNAKEECPVFFGGATALHHSFPDPASDLISESDRLDSFRSVRDQIRAYFRCEEFMAATR